ncbi:MAG: hypothetical protein ABI646_05630 [Acidobacteriota bacterium]
MRNYTDETLNFCLDDGTALLDGPGSEEAVTAIFHSEPRGATKVAGNLPAERTRFVGRAKELNDCIELVTGTGLLTITGFGGCGKTRLAIKCAEGLLKSFPDGASSGMTSWTNGQLARRPAVQESSQTNGPAGTGIYETMP